MPFTPFHFGPGAALHAVAPKHVSFLAFCAANVLVDVEPLYYIVTDQYPLHRFFHTYVGASLMVAAIVALFLFARWVNGQFKLPNFLRWQQLSIRAIAAGAALGCYTHIVLDSVMHADIRPFAPFSSSNGLYLWIGINELHWWCLAAGIVGTALLGLRRLLRCMASNIKT